MLQRLIDAGPALRMISLPRAQQRLHTMPTSTGCEIRTDSNYSWDGRKRGQTPFTVLQYTISGAGNLRHGGRSFRIGPGETMLVAIPHAHRYWVEAGGRWEFFWIAMHGAEALRIHLAVLATAGPVFKLQPATVDHLADCAARLITDPDLTSARASAIAYEVSMALYDDILEPHRTDLPADSALRQVTDYIGAHLHLPLPVDKLAELSGLSRSHFSRVFAAHEGMPPAEFVLTRRLDRAAKLLTMAADLSVKDVSAMCGFDDPNYFAKVFRRGFGASPTEFRTSGMYASQQDPDNTSHNPQ